MEAAIRQNLFTRDDTFLGICQGLGEDLGISPDLFRVAMIPALFFFPVQTLAAYFGTGAVVLFSRLVFPAAPRVRKGTGPRVEAKPAGIETELQMAA
ncbi:PspC domain-containing protein [Allosphingosinicella flava]|uniref:PspC domain-containing protein n=1 Tax=Allosphingosinicella flava TaxID=2771430 RepID=A0A7T2GKW6_9SPHN|nr:PspC domain-containing protein [Sphingosinicella flava]QPQ55756.1 PspC domain-containing protein [Sphingosinicella flava]